MVSAVSARDGFTWNSRQIVQPASVTEFAVVWHPVCVSSSPAAINAPVSLGTVLVTLYGPPCVEYLAGFEIVSDGTRDSEHRRYD